MESAWRARETRKCELQSMAVEREQRGGMEKGPMIQAWVRRGCCEQLGKKECEEGSEHGAEPGTGTSGWQHGSSAVGRKRLQEKPRSSLGWVNTERGVGKQGVTLRVAWEVPGTWKSGNKDEPLKRGAGVRSLGCRRIGQDGGWENRQRRLIPASPCSPLSLPTAGPCDHSSCHSSLAEVTGGAADILEMSQQCQVMRFFTF